jgi:hypothetical protein
MTLEFDFGNFVGHFLVVLLFCYPLTIFPCPIPCSVHLHHLLSPLVLQSQAHSPLLQQAILFRVLKGGVDGILLQVPFAERLQKDVKLEFLSCPSHYALMAALVRIFHFVWNGARSASPHGYWLKAWATTLSALSPTQAPPPLLPRRPLLARCVDCSV